MTGSFLAHKPAQRDSPARVKARVHHSSQLFQEWCHASLDYLCAPAFTFLSTQRWYRDDNKGVAKLASALKKKILTEKWLCARAQRILSYGGITLPLNIVSMMLHEIDFKFETKNQLVYTTHPFR